jgi:hypothetical protein
MYSAAQLKVIATAHTTGNVTTLSAKVMIIAFSLEPGASNSIGVSMTDRSDSTALAVHAAEAIRVKTLATVNVTQTIGYDWIEFTCYGEPALTSEA